MYYITLISSPLATNLVAAGCFVLHNPDFFSACAKIWLQLCCFVGQPILAAAGFQLAFPGYEYSLMPPTKPPKRRLRARLPAPQSMQNSPAASLVTVAPEISPPRSHLPKMVQVTQKPIPIPRLQPVLIDHMLKTADYIVQLTLIEPAALPLPLKLPHFIARMIDSATLAAR